MGAGQRAAQRQVAAVQRPSPRQRLRRFARASWGTVFWRGLRRFRFGSRGGVSSAGGAAWVGTSRASITDWAGFVDAGAPPVSVQLGRVQTSEIHAAASGRCNRGGIVGSSRVALTASMTFGNGWLQDTTRQVGLIPLEYFLTARETGALA